MSGNCICDDTGRESAVWSYSIDRCETIIVTGAGVRIFGYDRNIRNIFKLLLKRSKILIEITSESRKKSFSSQAYR